MIEELDKILNEGMESTAYNRETDNDVPQLNQNRKKILKLCDVNRLKKIRNKQREELAQDSVYVPILYGPNMNPEGGDMGMGGLPM